MAGDDTITNDGGDITIIGGAGADQITYSGDDNAEANHFIFGVDFGNDTVTGFRTTKDKIHLMTGAGVTSGLNDFNRAVMTVKYGARVLGTITFTNISDLNNLNALERRRL